MERRSPETKKKRKASFSGNGEDEENGVESLDWWTKYHASVETAIKVPYTRWYRLICLLDRVMDFFAPPRVFGLDTYPDRRYVTGHIMLPTSAFGTNSLRRRCCCKPTSHCIKSCDNVDLLERLRLRCKLRPALQFLAN